MRHVIILTELRPEAKKLFDVGSGIIGVFSNLKKAYNFIYTELPDTYNKFSYSKIAGFLAKGGSFELDGKLGILKYRVK